MGDFPEYIAVYRVGTCRLTCLEHFDRIYDVFNRDIKVVEGLVYCISRGKSYVVMDL